MAKPQPQLSCLVLALDLQRPRRDIGPGHRLEAYIEELFGGHPDHDLFGSLPGAGTKLAPRLLSEIGDKHITEIASALKPKLCSAWRAPLR